MQEKVIVNPILIASQRNVTEGVLLLRRLLVGLADASIVPVVVSPAQPDSYWTPSVPAHVVTYPVLDWPFANALGFESCVAQVEQYKPTIIHCLCPCRAWLASRLAQRLDIPYVLTLDIFLGRRRSLPISADHCAAIIVPAETIRAGVTQLLRPFSRRIKRINVGTFVGAEPVCFSARDHLTNVVVAPPAKTLDGYANLFEAIRILLGQGYEFITAVVGGGRMEHPLRRMLRNRGLREVVMVVPPLDPWRSLVAAADIYVQPQRSRMYSGRLLEAMSVGAAVVACKGGVDDLIIHNETSLVFDPDSEPSIRRALSQLLDDRDLARRLARQAQSHVKKHHSVAGMISATLNLYEESQRRYSHGLTTRDPVGAAVS